MKSIKGSISLKGAVIDDLIFKKYTETLNGNDQGSFIKSTKFK